MRSQRRACLAPDAGTTQYLFHIWGLLVTPQEVKGIATLARLSINEADIADYTDSLSRIIAFADQLNAVDTESIEPMAHPMDKTQRLRKDEVTAKDQHRLYQENAPAIEAGLYTVPRVLD